MFRVNNVNGTEKIVKFKIVLRFAQRMNDATIVYVNFRYFYSAFLFNSILCIITNSSYPNPLMQRFSVFKRFCNKIL
jgi:hypothetical protein